MNVINIPIYRGMPLSETQSDVDIVIRALKKEHPNVTFRSVTFANHIAIEADWTGMVDAGALKAFAKGFFASAQLWER